MSEGITVFPWPGPREPRIRIIDEPAPAFDPRTAAAIDAEWSRLRAANPRYYDGPILSVVRAAPNEDILCRRTGYKLLAVQPAVNTGVQLLSITAVILARHAGRDHALLGRRSVATRIYGGMWELGPSGGIDPPSEGSLNEADIVAAARREIGEEIARTGPLIPGPIRALLHDPAAQSWDIVIPFTAPDLTPAPAPARGWEYDETLWIPTADLPAFARTHPLIPPTQALIEHLSLSEP